MTAKEAYSKYNNNRVNSASQAELVLMLYDGCIKFCNMSKMYIENKDYENANIYIKKAQRIVEEFKFTLNHKYETAKDFDIIYDYILQILIEANVKKDTALIDKALGHLRDMREIWIKITKKK